MVQVPDRPSTPWVKLRSSAAPCGVCTTSGWNSSAVEAPRIVGDGGERRTLADRHHAEARRQARHAVAVAHPDLLAPALAPDAVEQRAVIGHVDEGAAEFAMVRALHLAAELVAHASARRSRCPAPARRPRTPPAARAARRPRSGWPARRTG